MSFIRDTVKISQLTIPGTHNTCAFKINCLAQCQNTCLTEQLCSGVRYLDIRCYHNMDRFELCHGHFKIDNDFECDVLKVLVSFLTMNPSETIIVALKPEQESRSNTRKFDETFLSYAKKYARFWYLADTIPTMQQARGKIVLLRRFFSMCLPLGIDMFAWEESQTFLMQNHPGVKFFIQDEFKLKENSKWCAIMNMFKIANLMSKYENVWFLNFTSASYWSLQTPFCIAQHINQRLTSYLECLNRNMDNIFCSKLNFGTIIVDFSCRFLVKNIYTINFTTNKSVVKERVNPYWWF